MCCETCGLTTAHRIVLYRTQRLEDIWTLIGRSSDYVGKLDYFNDTHLHCAATSCDEKTLEPLAIRHSIHVNASGETFLHVLRCTNWLDLEIFVQILRHLKAIRDVDIMARLIKRQDYHGRTLLHRLFRTADEDVFHGTNLNFILAETDLDINTRDSFGYTLQQIILDCVSRPSVLTFNEWSTSSHFVASS
jgi:hypothetical protein